MTIATTVAVVVAILGAGCMAFGGWLWRDEDDVGAAAVAIVGAVLIAVALICMGGAA